MSGLEPTFFNKVAGVPKYLACGNVVDVEKSSSNNDRQYVLLHPAKVTKILFGAACSIALVVHLL